MGGYQNAVSSRERRFEAALARRHLLGTPMRVLDTLGRVLEAAWRVLGTPRRVLATHGRVLVTPGRVLATSGRVLVTARIVFYTPGCVFCTPKLVLYTPGRVLHTPKRVLETPKRVVGNSLECSTNPGESWAHRGEIRHTNASVKTHPRTPRFQSEKEVLPLLRIPLRGGTRFGTSGLRYQMLPKPHAGRIVLWQRVLGLRIKG